MADSAVAASEDSEARNVVILGTDIGPGVVAFDVGVNLQVLPAAFSFEVEEAFDR